MFIWLPPSESKTPRALGPKLDLDALSFPALADSRRLLARRLAEASTSPDAAGLLGLGTRNAHEAQANTRLFTSACTLASQLFTGVLYEALGLNGLDEKSAASAESRVRIFSGLFGVLTPKDLIPEYRLAMNIRLGELGMMSTWWRPRLSDALEPEAGGALVVDARSGPYRAACPAPWARVLHLSVVRDRDGRRSVVSHDAKRWRGLVCRELLRLPETPQRRDDLIDAIIGCADAIKSMDALGAVHTIIGVEDSGEKPTGAGGSQSTLTIVTR